MQEIEVKAKVERPEELYALLAALGVVLSDPIAQYDRIFIPRGAELPVAPGVSVLRIREQNDAFLFTLKQAITNQLDCFEREVEVKEAEPMLDIFNALGFHEASRVRKVRRKGTYQHSEICVDEVEGLGLYIEVEQLVNDEDGEKIQQTLWEFLKTLGIRDEDRVHDGYDVLMARKSGGFGVK